MAKGRCRIGCRNSSSRWGFKLGVHKGYVEELIKQVQADSAKWEYKLGSWGCIELWCMCRVSCGHVHFTGVQEERGGVRECAVRFVPFIGPQNEQRGI